MDGVPVDVESLWPSVIRWKPVFSSNWKNIKNRRKGGGGTNDYLKIFIFFKNQKHQPNIVEITHLCIMHGVHTSRYNAINILYQ
jgi:hypothetical protein